jgi:alkylated DNA nucleotide flippase Atl1
MSSSITTARLASVVGAIPVGRWMSYGDVAHLCGGTDRHARTLNQRFIRDRIAGAHRVLTQCGAVSPGALGRPDAVRRQLESEGVVFNDAKADAAARLRPCDLLERGVDRRTDDGA